MIKISKQKYLIVTALLTILLVSSVYLALIPNVHAAEPTTQQKAISTLSNVVDLDTSQYNVSTTLYPDDLYQDILPRETVRSVLNTVGSKVETLCTFVSGSLQMIYVSANEGSPRMKTQNINDASKAQSFLTNYQAQTSNSFYGELNSMLTKADSDENFTATVGNIKLDATTLQNGATFRWTYTSNGILAPDKCVALRYENGFLKYFVDNWNLYKIGSTNLNLSEQEAIDIAIARAKFYSPDSSENGTIGGMKFNVANAMIIEKIFAPSIYVDSDKARSQDLLELYPMYNVWVSLDKFYPGNVYGFIVYVWADTKEVCYIHQRSSTIDPPAELVASGLDSSKSSGNAQSYTTSSVDNVESNSLPSWVMLPACAVAIFVLMPVCFRIKRKSSSSLGLPNIRCSKVGGMLLCFLIFSSLLLIAMSVSIVSAAEIRGAAIIWGAESTDAINYNLNPPESWRKSNDEVYTQRCIAEYLDELFADNGYFSSNSQGSNGYGSTKGAILDRTYYLDTHYPRMAVVDFDHGVGNIVGGDWHYLIEDQRGTFNGSTYHTDPVDNPLYAVYDWEIYEQTTGKAFFAFINTCLSARISSTPLKDGYSLQQGGGFNGNNTAEGLPFAWMHRKVVDNPAINEMSSDGYHSNTKDSGSHCYIGFDSGSPSLNQTVETSGHQYWYWVTQFFYYALSADSTIHSALDLATHDAFSSSIDFDESPLFDNDGFTSIWPMYHGDPPEWQYDERGAHSHMQVYGNADIKLYQPLLTLSGRDNNNNPCYPMFNIDGLEYDVGVGGYRLIPGVYEITVNDMTNYAFSHFSYQGSNYSRPANIEITDDSELIAHFTLVQQPLYISSSGSGYTYPTGTQWYDPFTSPLVQAYPDSGYENYWVLNDRFGGSGTSTYVYIDGSQTLQAVFYPEQPHYFAAALCDYDIASNPGDLTGWEYDDYFATIEGCGYYGWISGGMNKQASGHIYVRGCGDGPLYVYVSSNGEDWELVSTPEVTSETPYWIDCGICQDQFSYIKLTAEGDVAHIEMDSVKVEPLVYYDLTISAGAHGTTNPSPGLIEDILGGTQYGVTAIPDSGYVLDHWLLDGNNVGNQNPKYVTMDGNHTLQAVFDQNPNNPWLTVEAYDGYTYYELYPEVYVDSGYVGAAPVSVQVTAASHDVEVDDMIWSDYTQCYVYFYYFYDDSYYYYYDNPASISVTSDMTLKAWYYP